MLNLAKLNLSYCKIAAPVAGIVAKRMAEVRTDVTPGQQVLLIAQLDDLWVTANFRETQLRAYIPGKARGSMWMRLPPISMAISKVCLPPAARSRACCRPERHRQLRENCRAPAGTTSI